MMDESGEDGGVPTEDGGPEGQTNEQAYEAVFAEIERQRTQQKSWVTNIFILAFSLLIFFQLGLFSWGLEGLLTLIGVIVIHELGHLFGMRMFGYKNVQMFFIPFFGAAVSGEKRDVAAYKEAIVSLLGPAPGIIIGCVLAVMFAASGRKDYLNLATMFLFINVFNLLPFYPLDGGRFFYTVLFCRNQYLELCFRIFAALALVLVGYAMSSWLLGILGLVNLWAVKMPFRIAKAAREVKQSEACRNLFACGRAEIDSEAIPPSVGKVIIDKVYERFPLPIGINIAAGHTKQIWERVCFRPGGVFSTVGLMVVYFFLFLLPLAALIGSVVVGRSSLVETKMVEYQKPDGSMGLKEQKYFGGKLSSETEVGPESYLYHGKCISYSHADANIVSQEGTWNEGKWDGEWKTYNSQGELVRVTILDKGNFVSQKEKVDGQWVEKKWEDLPSLYRLVIKKQQERVSGPKKKRK
ncbi:MAG: site-2 protease family protein [Phycisphaerae bacterium]|jgi:Zn-dependent protease